MSRVILQDLRVLKFCNRGARVFLDRHGLDWDSFIQDGVDLARVEAIDDDMARQVVEVAKQRITETT